MNRTKCHVTSKPGIHTSTLPWKVVFGTVPSVWVTVLELCSRQQHLVYLLAPFHEDRTPKRKGSGKLDPRAFGLISFYFGILNS